MNLTFNYNLDALIILLVGIAFCFYGFKLKKIGIMLAWFSLGYYLANFAIDAFSISLDPTWALATPIVTGCIFGIAGYSLVKYGLYLICSFLAYIVVNNLALFDPQYNVILGIILAVVIGFLAAKFLKPVIIISTAIGGASIAISACQTLINGLTSDLYNVAFIGMIIVGMLWQFSSSKGS